MSKILKLLVAILLATQAISAQDLFLEEQAMVISSNYFNQEETVHITEPMLLSFTDQSKFSIPLLILFDRQNDVTFERNLKSIDYLSGVGGQMPPLLVVGIDFNMENRYYRTSEQKLENDSLSGIERMAGFIFEELIPKLREKYPSIGEVFIGGHSRTGYLVNYLTIHHHDRFDAGFSFSGFFTKENEMEELLKVAQSDDLTKPFYFYFTSGDSWEESNYLEDCQELSKRLSSQHELTSPLFMWQFYRNAYANHITNYGISLPQVLITHFSDFSELLGNWFGSRFEEVSPDAALMEYRKDLALLRTKVPYSELHINSFASHYLFSIKNNQTAREFVGYGLQYVPRDPGLVLFMAELLLEDGLDDEAQIYFTRFNELMESETGLDELYRQDLLEWYESLTAP